MTPTTAPSADFYDRSMVLDAAITMLRYCFGDDVVAWNSDFVDWRPWQIEALRARLRHAGFTHAYINWIVS